MNILDRNIKAPQNNKPDLDYDLVEISKIIPLRILSKALKMWTQF